MARSKNFDILEDLEKLHELYVTQGLTTHEIADMEGCVNSTVGTYLRKHDIPVRKKGARKRDKHPRWVDRDTNRYQGSWDNARQEALRRDDFCCQSCGATQEQHKREFCNGLEVHHHKPKCEFEAPEDAHQLENLIVVCRVCHAKYERGLYGPFAGINHRV